MAFLHYDPSRNSKICRTCLAEESDQLPMYDFETQISSDDNKCKTIRQQLRWCLPELELHNTPYAAMCADCLTSLNTSFQYKEKSLQAEKSIRKGVKISGVRLVDRAQAVELNKNPDEYPEPDGIKEEPGLSDNSCHTCPFIKPEPVYIDPNGSDNDHVYQDSFSNHSLLDNSADIENITNINSEMQFNEVFYNKQQISIPQSIQHNSLPADLSKVSVALNPPLKMESEIKEKILGNCDISLQVPKVKDNNMLTKCLKIENKLESQSAKSEDEYINNSSNVINLQSQEIKVKTKLPEAEVEKPQAKSQTKISTDKLWPRRMPKESKCSETNKPQNTISFDNTNLQTKLYMPDTVDSQIIIKTSSDVKQEGTVATCDNVTPQSGTITSDNSHNIVTNSENSSLVNTILAVAKRQNESQLHQFNSQQPRAGTSKSPPPLHWLRIQAPPVQNQEAFSPFTVKRELVSINSNKVDEVKPLPLVDLPTKAIVSSKTRQALKRPSFNPLPTPPVKILKLKAASLLVRIQSNNMIDDGMSHLQCPPNVDHDNEELEDNSFYKCNDCTFECDSKTELVAHVSSHLQLKLEIKAASVSKTKSSHRRTRKLSCKLLYKYRARTYRTGLKRPREYHTKLHKENKLLRCAHCDYMCATKSNLSVHIAAHTRVKPHKCTECNFSTVSKSALVPHTQTHTFHCHVCQYSTRVKSALNMHVRIHGHKPYNCTQCGYRCSQRSGLNVHMRVHKGDKPFQCTGCEYRCTNKRSLAVHYRIHTKETPYKCVQCDYTTPLKSALNVHTRIHRDRTRLKCTQCNYKCAKHSTLKVHMHTHNDDKPFQCLECEYECSYECSTKSGLQSNPYQCEICDYRCKRKLVLKRHLGIHKKQIREEPKEEGAMIQNESIGLNNLPIIKSALYGSLMTDEHSNGMLNGYHRMTSELDGIPDKHAVVVNAHDEVVGEYEGYHGVVIENEGLIDVHNGVINQQNTVPNGEEVEREQIVDSRYDADGLIEY